VRVVPQIREIYETRLLHSVLSSRQTFDSLPLSVLIPPPLRPCLGLPPGPEPNVTMIGNEWIDLRCQPQKKEEQVDEKSELDRMVESKTSLKCSNCGEYGHWTLKCPKRKQLTEELPAETGPARYTAPYRRDDDDEGDLTVRISNLTEDTTDNDFWSLVHEVCKKFNLREPIRCHVARYKNTDKARGFAFVTFTSKDTAAAAVEAFNRYPFDTVILEAQLAGRKERRDDNRDKASQEDITARYERVDRDVNIASRNYWKN